MTKHTFLRSNNFRNAVWNLMEVLLSPAIFLVSIPLFLKLLGAQAYGEWMLFNAIIVVLQVFDFGLATSTYKHVAQNIASGNDADSARLLNTNISLSILITAIMLLLCFVLWWGSAYFPGSAKQFLRSPEHLVCLLLSVCILCTKLIEKILFSAFRAFEHFKTVTYIAVLLKIGVVLATLLVAGFYGDVRAILGTIFLFQLLGLLITYRQLKYRLRQYRFAIRIQSDSLRAQFRYTMLTWLQSVVVVLAYQSDKLFISVTFGMVVLSYYSIVATIFNHIHMALMALTPWLFPQVAKHSRDDEKNNLLYIKARNISAAISIFLLSLFGLFYPFFISLWLGADKLAHMNEYIKWFTIFELFFIFTINKYSFLNANGSEQLALRIALMFTSINAVGMVLAYCFIQKPEALPMGLAISSLPAMYLLHIMMGSAMKVRNNGTNSMLLLLPSCAAAAILLSHQWYFKLFWLLVTCGLLYFIFLKPMIKTLSLRL